MVQKLRTSLTNGYHKLMDTFILGSESALVVSWWDIVLLTVFTMLIFMFLGPIMDSVFLWINGTVNNPITVNFYKDSDLTTARDLYNIYYWVPYLAIGVIVFYALNYSNISSSLIFTSPLTMSSDNFIYG